MSLAFSLRPKLTQVSPGATHSPFLGTLVISLSGAPPGIWRLGKGAELVRKAGAAEAEWG